MADRELQIQITTLSSLYGANAVQDALNNVGRTGTRAMGEVEQASEKVHVSHRAMRFALHQMGGEFAHLGHAAIYGFANPLTGGMIVAALAVGGLVKHFKEVEKAAKEAAEKAFSEMEKLNEQAITLSTHIEELKNKFENLAGAMPSVGSVITAELDAEIEKLKNIEKLALGIAKLRGQSETTQGVISSGAGQMESGAIATAQKQTQEQIQQISKQLLSARGDIGRFESLIEKVLPEEIKFLEERAKAHIAGGHPGLARLDQEQITEDQSRLARMKREKELEEKRLTDLNKEYDELLKLRGSLIDKQTTLTGHQGVESGLSTEKRRQELAEMGFTGNKNLGQTLLKDIEFAEAKAGGASLTSAQQESLRTLYNVLKQQGATQEQVNKVFLEMFDLHVSHAAKIEDIRVAMRQLKAQQKATFNQ